MDQEWQNYLERRERSERAAAKKATCPQAQRVHQELALKYAALIRQAAGQDGNRQAMFNGSDEAGRSSLAG
jgi:hypothetical protein